MKRIRFISRNIALGTLLPLCNTAFASNSQTQTFNVSGWFAGGITLTEITSNLFGTLRGTAVFLAATIFIIGAFYLTLGFNSQNQSTGKNMMIGALIGLAIIIGAWAIFNTIFYFTQV